MKFDKPVHVGAPNIGSRERFFQLMDEMFDRRWLTNRGPLVQQLEEHLCEYLGVSHCVTMCNATVALEIAAKALGLKGEVIVPSLTFVATAHALQWQGITPVFCDIDRNTYNLDPWQVERHITPKTSGIMATHLYSRLCNIDALQEIADRHHLKLIFDAAHAFGCEHQGKMIGNFGDCEVFSFHATKFFNTFEGGAIATNNAKLAETIRLMQNFGFSGFDNVIHLGTNGKMSEASAAMGLTNMESINDFLDVNKQNYLHYKAGLSNIPGLKLIDYEGVNCGNWQYIVVEIAPHYPLCRDALIARLHENNVLARRYFWPGCHRMEPYKSLYPNAGTLLPVTEDVAERLVVLPTGTSVNKEMISVICSLLAGLPLDGLKPH